MPTDMSIKIKDLEGECKANGHDKEIDVLSFSFGATQSGTAGKGGGLGAGKAHVQDMKFTKRVDKSSPLLFQKCVKGEHLKEAILFARKAGGSQVDYLKVTLTDCIITSISTGAVADDDLIHETVTLNFSKIKEEYTPQDKAGAGLGVVSAGWDVETSVAS